MVDQLTGPHHIRQVVMATVAQNQAKPRLYLAAQRAQQPRSETGVPVRGTRVTQQW